MARESYAELDHWRRYEPHLPEELHLSSGAEPAEEWWPWREMEVHIDRLARPEAPAKVLLLHGGGGNGRLLSFYGAALWRAGYEALSPDLPGFGITRVPRKRVLDYRTWLDCVSGLVEAETESDPRPLVLLGASMGGMLAYESAARTRRVAGVAATCLLDPTQPEVRQAVARNRFLGGPGMTAMSALRPLTDPLPVPMRLVSRTSGLANDPELLRVCRADRLAAGNWMPARFLRTFMEHEPQPSPEAFDACPLLLVHPGEDRWTDISLSLRVFDRLTVKKRLVVLEGCGHLPAERPGVDQLRHAVIGFLEEVTAFARSSSV